MPLFCSTDSIRQQCQYSDIWENRERFADQQLSQCQWFKNIHLFTFRPGHLEYFGELTKLSCLNFALDFETELRWQIIIKCERRRRRKTLGTFLLHCLLPLSPNLWALTLDWPVASQLEMFDDDLVLSVISISLIHL